MDTSDDLLLHLHLSLRLLLHFDLALTLFEQILLCDDQLKLFSVLLVVHDFLHLQLELHGFGLLILQITVD